MKHLGILLALSALVSTVPASAGMDIDFGVSVRLGDESDVYVAISSRYFDRSQSHVQRIAVWYEDPDDLAVALQIMRYSGARQRELYELRSGGMSWWEISVRLGVPTDAWFVEVDRDPGPPYGNAYGYWKNQRRGKKHKHRKMQLSDAEMRDLIAVRMVHEYYGVRAEVAMDWRASGRDLSTIMVGEYGKRHGAEERAAKDSGHPGRGKTKKHSKR